MESEPRSIEEIQQSETARPSTLLKLPKLGHQRSLQDLIRDDLNSQDDSFLAISTLFAGGDENPNLEGATIEASASEIHDERPKIPDDSASPESSRQDHKATALHNDRIIAHASLWSRLFKR